MKEEEGEERGGRRYGGRRRWQSNSTTNMTTRGQSPSECRVVCENIHLGGFSLLLCWGTMLKLVVCLIITQMERKTTEAFCN